MISLKQGGMLLLLALLSSPSRIYAAPAQFDIDLKELERQKPAAPPKTEKKKAQKTKKAPVAAAATGKVRHGTEDGTDYLRYTVKPGDHIFKILIVRFGMSNEAAERLIPEIIRINDISNIKRLTVGRTLLIPKRGEQESTARSSKKGKSEQREAAAEADAMLEKASKLAAHGASAPPAPTKEEPPIPPPGVPVAPAVVTPAPSKPTPAAEAQKPVSVPVPPPVSASTPAAAPPPLSILAPPPPVLASEPAPKPVQAPAPTPRPAPLAVPPPPVPVVAATPPVAAPFPQATTWVCSVTEKDSIRSIDAILNALSIFWSKNRIIQSADGAPNTFSIRVDRYFEYKGERYIVSVVQNDPYIYTLLRLLEGAGYKVLTISGGEDFKTAGEKLLKLVGVRPDFAPHKLQGGKYATGFLVQQDDAGGRQVVITGNPVDPHQKWLLPPGCAGR